MSSTTRMRRAAPWRRLRACGRRGAGCARRSRQLRRQTHVNSVPCPRPSLCASTRAAVQLDQVLDQRQADAQAALRAVERLVGLREQVEDVRQQRRRDADAVVLHRDHDLAFARRALSQMRPPGRCIWRRCSAGWTAPAPGASDRRPARPARAAARPSSAARGASMQRRSWPRPALDQRRQLSRSRLHDRPCRCTMRETSSRSSIRRAMWSTWRPITSRAQLQRGLRRRRRAAGCAGRCGSAPADCAARAPAWPGIRSCAGPPPAPRNTAARSPWRWRRG